jgi:hypothetical protein
MGKHQRAILGPCETSQTCLERTGSVDGHFSSVFVRKYREVEVYIDEIERLVNVEHESCPAASGPRDARAFVFRLGELGR